MQETEVNKHQFVILWEVMSVCDFFLAWNSNFLATSKAGFSG